MRTISAAIFLSVVTAAAADSAFRDRLTPPAAGQWEFSGGSWTPGRESLDVKPADTATARLKDRATGHFQLDVELRATREGSAAAVVFRRQDGEGDPGYRAGIRAGENRLVWSVTGEAPREIASKPIEIRAGDWYHLRVQAEGGRMRIFLEPRPVDASSWPVFDGLDTAFAKGGIALQAEGGEASW